MTKKGSLGPYSILWGEAKEIQGRLHGGDSSITNLLNHLRFGSDEATIRDEVCSTAKELVRLCETIQEFVKTHCPSGEAINITDQSG